MERPPHVWVGQRFRFGGDPELRNSPWPTCSSCGQQSTSFLGHTVPVIHRRGDRAADISD